MLPIYKIAGLCYNILYKSNKPDVCGIRKESIMRTLSLKARITVTVVIIMAATLLLTATISNVFMAVNSTKNITRAASSSISDFSHQVDAWLQKEAQRVTDVAEEMATRSWIPTNATGFTPTSPTP